MRESELTEFYIEQLLSLLGTPIGVAGLLALLALVLGVVTVPSMRWACVALVIYVATLPLTQAANVQYVPLAPVLDQLRSYGRPLIFLFLALMLVPLAASSRGWRRQLVAWPLLMFLAFELLISLRLALYGNFARGGLSVMSYGLVMLTLGVGLSRWLQTPDDAYKLVWALCLAGGMVAVATCYQLAVNRALIITGGRLTGVTGNPQFMGVIMAYTIPFACLLLMRPSGRKWVRPLLVGQVAVMIVLLVWTGSRTGALATTCGLAVMFHRRLGRFAVMAVVVATVVYFVLPFFQGSADIADRLLWTENTRAHVWSYMWESFKTAPWLGMSRDSFSVQENSYLAMLAQFGVLGSLPCLVAVVLLVWQLAHLWRMRHRLGPDSALVDTAIAAWAVMFISSVFEGLLMGVITFPVLMIYSNASLTTFLVDWIETDESYVLSGDAPYAAAA